MQKSLPQAGQAFYLPKKYTTQRKIKNMLFPFGAKAGMLIPSAKAKIQYFIKENSHEH